MYVISNREIEGGRAERKGVNMVQQKEKIPKKGCWRKGIRSKQVRGGEGEILSKQQRLHLKGILKFLTLDWSNTRPTHAYNYMAWMIGGFRQSLAFIQIDNVALVHFQRDKYKKHTDFKPCWMWNGRRMWMNWGTGFYRDPFAFKNTNGRKYLQTDGQTNYQRSLRPKKLFGIKDFLNLNC